MDGFKKYTEEQIAAYLEGKGGIDDIDFVNALIQDDELSEVIDIIEQIDIIDQVDNNDYLDKTQ